MAKEDPERWLLVDAAQPVEAVSASIKQVLAERLQLPSTD